VALVRGQGLSSDKVQVSEGAGALKGTRVSFSLVFHVEYLLRLTVKKSCCPNGSPPRRPNLNVSVVCWTRSNVYYPALLHVTGKSLK
jgi:hypothetical protein